MNVIGVRDAARVTNIFTIGKLIPIILFIAVGLFFISRVNYSFGERPAYGAFSSSVLILIYAFSGFEMAAIPAGEVRDPQRNLPIALLTAIGVVALVYILVQVICIGTLPGLATSGTASDMSIRRFAGIRFSVDAIAASHVISRPV